MKIWERNGEKIFTGDIVTLPGMSTEFEVLRKTDKEVRLRRITRGGKPIAGEVVVPIEQVIPMIEEVQGC